MKGAVLSASGQSTFNDEEFADSVLQTTKCAFKDDASKQRCGVCGTTNTPCWRKGPSGPKTLCNRCGVHWYQNKDRWEHIVEELRATRVDETPEQASAPTRTVIKKKVDPGSAATHPAVPDSQRCVKSNGRGWRCSQRKVPNYSYCAHHQRNWDGHEKQWRKAFPNLVYPRKSKKGGDPSEGGLVRKGKAQGAVPPQGGGVRKRKPVKVEGKRGVMLPDKTWASGKANRMSDDSSEPDYVDSLFGKVRTQYGSYERSEGLVKEGSGSMMQLVLPSETDELCATRPLEAGYVSEDDDSQLYHGTQLSEEPGESLESAKEVRSPNHADRHSKPEPSLRSDVTALSRPGKTTDSPPPADDQRCVMKGGTGWRCPRPRHIGLRYCEYHIEARRARLKEKEGLEETGAPLSGMEILLRLQLKRKRSEGETGLAGNGLGLTWKTKMRRRPFSSRGGPVADVKQGSDMSQDSPRPQTVDHPPETEWGGRREEEDDAEYLGVEELRRRLEASRGAIAAQQEKNKEAGRELMRAKEGRLMAERQLEDAKKEAVLRGGDAAEVEKLRNALQAERANASLLRPEALKLADQFKHQAVLLSKQGAHLTHLRTSAEELRQEVATLTAEKKELQAQLSQLHKANACTLCASGKSASTALVPCGHLYCDTCTSTLVTTGGGPVTGLLIDAPLRATEAPAKIEAAAIEKGGACDSSVDGFAKLIVENGGRIEKTSKCPCCLVEVKGRLVVHKPAHVDEEMDGAVSLLGLLASESS